MRRFFVLLVGLVACSSSNNVASTPTITTAGSWTGSTSGETFDLVLTQTNGSVAGSGSLLSPVAATIPLSVTGAYVAPTASLTFSSTGFKSINFTGTVVATTMTGILNGSGFTNAAITFTKQ
jgi:hypothetical protein